jgi:transcriptional regulator with XRE-family HTH domain
LGRYPDIRIVRVIMTRRISLHADYIKMTKELREIRERLGMSQDEASKNLKQYRTYISKIESGERRIDVIELIELLHLYGLSLAQFARRVERRSK